jgi:putative membrane protein
VSSPQPDAVLPSQDSPEHPDYRFTPANGRTLLAWLRTGLALVAGAVAVATYAPDLAVGWAARPRRSVWC